MSVHAEGVCPKLTKPVTRLFQRKTVMIFLHALAPGSRKPPPIIDRRIIQNIFGHNVCKYSKDRSASLSFLREPRRNL